MEQNNSNQTIKSYKGSTINNMANIALVLGLISLFMCTTIVIPLLLGSFGIIIAVLSKGRNIKMHPVAKAGMFSSFLSLAIAVFITGYTYYMMQTSPEFRAQMSESFEKVYGMTIDEYFEAYGVDASLFNQ